MTNQNDFDVLIVGGGMVGASLAIALRDQPVRIGMIEAVAWQVEDKPGYDDRTIALAWGSRRIFDSMGVWQAMTPDATAIKTIHVSDQGHFGFTRLDARQQQVEALGYVITARAIGKVLTQQLAEQTNVTLISPATVTNLECDKHCATVTVNQEGQSRQYTTSLLVGADGVKSTIRELLSIDTTMKDYGQTAVIANLTTEKAHNHIAFERFTRTGPLALLPMDDHRCALVWTVETDEVDDVMSLDDDRFLQAVQKRFGYRLGKLLKVGKRDAYPLRLVRAQEQVRERLVLIGNAVHTLHPVGGQGFNLGLRDVATLAQVIAEARHTGNDIGSLPILNHYAEWRISDHERVIGFTDNLVKLFSNDSLPLSFARNVGLLAADVLPPVKKALLRRTMGIYGHLPRLARGLCLQEPEHGT
ncbi:MAG: 2-octaprenyl-6-methoxyphenyl hydroxylase [Gammaproteobacteria bacterium]|nr:2-octaprenyl-6-methoxyphenyl hydroxylase [Gammaproteobacteria bacterium]